MELVLSDEVLWHIVAIIHLWWADILNQKDCSPWIIKSQSTHSLVNHEALKQILLIWCKLVYNSAIFYAKSRRLFFIVPGKKKCNEKRWTLGGKKQHCQWENSLCNMIKSILVHWAQRTRLIAGLCENPRPETRCDNSLSGIWHSGRAEKLTLQINSSLRERSCCPNQSVRCLKHLGQHLATAPFSSRKPQTEAVVRRSHPWNTTKEIRKEPLPQGKGLLFSRNTHPYCIDSQAQICMPVFYSRLHPMNVLHFGWTAWEGEGCAGGSDACCMWHSLQCTWFTRLP